MEVLIKNATILHSLSPLHGQKRDILIRDGIIQRIAPVVSANGAQVIDIPELYVSAGLCDIGTQGGEPGYEHRESMDSLTKSALAGGYTALVLLPKFAPVTQHKSHVTFLRHHNHRNGVAIYPAGSLSIDGKGADMTEMEDMFRHGVVAFTDGLTPVKDSGLLSRALQYAASIGAPVIHHPLDSSLASGGEMHEGSMSTSLGLKGVPDIAEWQMVLRDIHLAGYYVPTSVPDQAAFVEHALSSAASLRYISESRTHNTRLKATVPYLNLIFADTDLADFSTSLKVVPVLRSEEDRSALCSGVSDGIIDAIISNHVPLDEESKKVEFPYAKPGASGLETCLPACLDALTDSLGLAVIIDALTVKPRQIIGLTVPEITEGVAADLCVFSTNSPWEFRADVSKSRGKNNPFDGHIFNSRVIATFCS